METVQRFPQLAPHDLAEEVPAPDPDLLVQLKEYLRSRLSRRKPFRPGNDGSYATARVLEHRAADPLRDGLL